MTATRGFGTMRRCCDGDARPERVRAAVADRVQRSRPRSRSRAFADDVVFTSPVAARVVPDRSGVISGTAALRAYWTAALARVPDLRFEIVGVYAGIDIVMINYRNQAGGMVSEVLTFADGLVVAGHGSYLMTGGRPGG